MNINNDYRLNPFTILFDMEITDDKLRQIVRETLRELGPHADPALVQKVVRQVVRLLMKPGDHPVPSSTDAAHSTPQFVLSMFHSDDGASEGASQPKDY